MSKYAISIQTNKKIQNNDVESILILSSSAATATTATIYLGHQGNHLLLTYPREH
jgi:hypothetical protein